MTAAAAAELLKKDLHRDVVFGGVVKLEAESGATLRALYAKYVDSPNDNSEANHGLGVWSG